MKMELKLRDFKVHILALSVVVFGILAFGLILYFCGGKCKTAMLKSQVHNKSAAVSTAREDVKDVQNAVPSTAPITEERVYYDFESDLNGWEIPMWARGKSDYVASKLTSSKKSFSHGSSSMEVMVSFPGGIWAAGLVEIQQYLDLTPYRVVSADIYLPPDAPMGLKTKMILTIGDNWKFVEMSRSIPLIPGEWVTLHANIEPGSYDWKRIVPDAKFSEDVRKVAIRIESNRKPKYTGPIYIDNIRCGK